MCWKAAVLVGFASVIISAVPTWADEKKDKLYLVALRDRKEISGHPSNLSPALIAMKDADGQLKGSDTHGKPVIAVTEEQVENLKKSRAVMAVEDAPKDWNPVKRLKISYKDKLTVDELKQMGLHLIDDYEKGSFMIVEVVGEGIDSQLARKLEGNPKILYATPSLRVTAIPIQP
jgi:hypothetical protein